jgi:NTE family protein
MLDWLRTSDLQFCVFEKPSAITPVDEVIIETMKKKLAIVFSGGGSRGSLQVGALRAIYEAGLNPDILVGTSVGACNAAFLAIRGFTPESLDRLEYVWRDAGSANLLPNNLLLMTLRTVLNRRVFNFTNNLRNFLIKHGLDEGLTFQDLSDRRLYVVTADINMGELVLFGQDPGRSILDGVMASAALPPWISPFTDGERLLVDGGVISNLPVRSAIDVGASEIIALDLEPPLNHLELHGFGSFFLKLIGTLHRQQSELELTIAQQKKVPICHIRLCDSAVPIWDFSHTEEFILQGYQIAKEQLQSCLGQRTLFSWTRKLSQQFKTWKEKIPLPSLF